MNSAYLTCFGGVGSVTGANFLLELGEKKILIDCGLFQGVNEKENENDFEYDPNEIDYLFITHSHIDHIGRVPLLLKNGFKGKIFSTTETLTLAKLMLADAVKVGGLFSLVDVERCFEKWHEIPYHTKTEFEGFSVEAYNAGHILGSAMYRFSRGKGDMLFADDLGNPSSVLLSHSDKPKGVKYLLMDSVYGDRIHEDKKTRDEKFLSIVREVREKKGTLLIPAFSLERTQSMLYELNEIFEHREVEPYPVFLDSPLAIKVTEVYEHVSKYFRNDIQEETKKDDIFKFRTLRETAQVRDSKEIANTSGPKIIIAGSGMSTAGRIVGHEETYLPDPNTTILFIGYQAPGTLGRLIEDGEKKVSIEGREVTVRARVERIGDFSAHADKIELACLAADNADTLKKVFLAMGEPKSSIHLAQHLHDELGLNAIVPERGKRYELEI